MPFLGFRKSIAPEGASYNSHVAMKFFVGGGFSHDAHSPIPQKHRA